MFDTHTNAGTFGVGRLLFRRQGLVAPGSFVNMRCVAFLFQPLFLRLGTIGAVRPHILAVIAGIEHIVQRLTVMDTGVRDFVFANELGICE